MNLDGNILLLDRWCDEAKEILGKDNLKSPLIITAKGVVVSEQWPYAENTEGIITSLEYYLGKEEIDGHPNLKFIASGTTGLDHIDLEYCNEKGIDVLSLQGETDFLLGVHSTAEHTIGLMLALMRKVPFAVNDVCNGNYNREKWQGQELNGKTLGVVGYGRLGWQVSQIAHAFGMPMKLTDPRAEKSDIMAYWYLPLGLLLGDSDIVTLHVPLNKETYHLIGLNELSMMKKSAYLINTSRSAVVDEKALIDALYAGDIAGAALDFLPDDAHLRSVYIDYMENNDNLIVTPHCGGNTVESRRKTQVFLSRKIRDYIESK